MAKGERPESELSKRGGRRRRRPPVLDLKATEVGEESPKADAKGPKAEDARARTGAARFRAQLGAVDWRGLATTPAVAGAAGVIGGAVVVFTLMSLFGGPDDESGRMSEIPGEVAALSARIEALAKRPAPAVAVPAALGERIDRLTAAIGETEQRLAAIEQRPVPPAPDLSAVNQRTAAIESTLKDLRATLGDLRGMAEQTPPAASPAAVATLTERIGALEDRIATLATPRPAPSTSALADEIVALNALHAAVQSGAPYVKELEAVRARLGERAAPLKALEPFATQGLPTVAALAERFQALVPELLRAPEPEGNIFSRLFTNAARLVEIRRVGEPEGDSLGAVVARMETKLGRGDLAGALAESESLPERAKETASGWIEAAAQRRDAERAVQGLIEAVLTTGTGRKQS